MSIREISPTYSSATAIEREIVENHLLREIYNENKEIWGSYQPSFQQLINECFQAYQNALTGADFAVLGSSSNRYNTELLANCGTLSLHSPNRVYRNITKYIHDTEQQLIGRHLKERVNTHLRSGAVICEKNWNLLKNDFFLLGIAHARKTVYVSSKSFFYPLLWDQENQRPRVLGRELLILAAHKYTPSLPDYEDGGIILTPSKKITALPLTAVRNFLQQSGVKKFLKTISSST